MMELDVTNAVITILIGVGTGIGLVALYMWYVLRKFKTKIDQLVQDVVEQAKDSMVAVIVEEDAGQLYCYREQDQQFLCQGATLADIRQAFGQQFPEKTAYLADGHDPALVARLQAQLEQVLRK